MKSKRSNRSPRVTLIASVLALAAAQAWADGRGVAYVSNQNGGVSVIDLDTMQTTGSIDVEGDGPRGMGITAEGKHLVVAVREAGGVVIVDTATRKVIKHIKVGKNPEFVRVRGQFAFVSYEPSSKGGPPPKGGSEAHGKDDDDDDREPAKVAVIDLKKGKVIRTIVGGPETEGLEFTPDGKRLAVTNEADNTVTVHDIASGKLVQRVDVSAAGQRPRGIKVSPDGSQYVVTLEFADKLLVLDTQFKTVKEAATGKTPYGVAFDASGERLYVAASREKALQVFDARTLEKIKDVPTGDRCWHFTFTPDQKQLLVACGKSNEVVVIDAEKLEVVQKIADKDLPWGVLVFPRAMGSLDQR